MTYGGYNMAQSSDVETPESGLGTEAKQRTASARGSGRASRVGGGPPVSADGRLGEAQARLQALFEFAPDGFYISDLRGTFIDGNRAAEEMVGYKKEELIGKSFLEMGLLGKRDLARAARLLARNALGYGTGPDEFTLRRRDGGRVPVEIRTFPVTLAGRSVVLAVARDITERRRRESAQRSGKGPHRMLLDDMADVVWTMGMDLRFSYISPSVVQMAGYTVEEVMALSFKQVLTPESLEVAMKALEEELAAEQLGDVEDLYRTRVLHLESVCKDGSARWLEVAVTFLRDAQGSPCGILGVARDISERGRAKMLLGQVAELTSGLLAYSPNPVLVLNGDSSVGYVNRALEKLTGFAASEIVGGKPPYPWWTAENCERHRKDLARGMHGGNRKREQMFRSKRGVPFWAEVTSVRVEVQGRLVRYLEYWVDVTEQKRLRENMGFYISEIIRAQEEERRCVAQELHDESIQRLSALSLNMDAMLRDGDRLPADVMRRIKELRAQVNGTVDGLRSFVRHSRPSVIDQLGLVSALEILAEEMSRNEATGVSLEIVGRERRLGPETELVLFRIAEEALGNMTRHSGATQARMRVKFGPGNVRLTVSDNGRGFELPRGLRELATRGKLGLIGMQERARLLDARFRVRSRIGGGTTIVVEAAAGESAAPKCR